MLASQVDAIVDAIEPGGDGNPFVDGLTTEQREALAALYRVGFPRRAERQLASPQMVARSESCRQKDSEP